MAWHLMRHGQTNQNQDYMEFMLDDESTDIMTEPTEFGKIPMGSIAYSVEPGSTALNMLWMKCADGTWIEM